MSGFYCKKMVQRDLVIVNKCPGRQKRDSGPLLPLQWLWYVMSENVQTGYLVTKEGILRGYEHPSGDPGDHP